MKPSPSIRHSVAAFTMVEIALALAVIGFALVAIVGVLPQGLTIQKNNREDTLVSQDGPFLIEAIRSGAKGVEALSNNVAAIYAVTLDPFGNRLPPVQISPNFLSESASNIVGVLSTPVGTVLEVPAAGGGPIGRPLLEFLTVLRPIGGAAVERSATLEEFAFRYVVASQVFAAPDSADPPGGPTDANLKPKLNSVSLRFVWPVNSWADNETQFLERFPLGEIYGRSEQVFRTEFGGRIVSPPLANGDPNEVTFFARPNDF